MARIRPHIQLIGALLIALIAGGAVGAAVLGSSGRVRTITATSLRVTTTVHTVYQTRVKIVPARVPQIASAQSRDSRTASPHAGSGPSAGSPAGSSPVVPGPAPGPPQHFAGVGPTTLGNIIVTGAATLRWTNTSGRFRILFDGNAVGVDSTAAAGSTTAPAQTYHQVKVDTPGRWTINIT